MKSHPSERIFSHVFRGKRFNVFWRRKKHFSAGSCDHPTTKFKHFALDLKCEENNSCERLLQAVFEEGLHACFPDIEDQVAADSATDIARFATRMGFEWTFDRKKTSLPVEF